MNKLIVVFFLVISGSLFAREFSNKEQYKIATGKTEISVKHWLTADRKNESRQWKAACKYNFSYEKGYLEFKTLEEQNAFASWINAEFKNTGFINAFPGVYRERLYRLSLISKCSGADATGKFASEAHEALYVIGIKALQELWLKGVLPSLEAADWDHETIVLIEKEIIQPIFSRLATLDYLDVSDTWARRNHTGKKSLPIELTFTTSNMRRPTERINYMKSMYVPYVKGERYTKENKVKLKRKMRELGKILKENRKIATQKEKR